MPSSGSNELEGVGSSVDVVPTTDSPGPAFPVRVAMIGAGGVSRLHLEAFAQLTDSVILAAACDPRVDAAAALVEPLPYRVPIYGDHHDVIEGAEIDAAIIALPHFLHFPVARDFVEAGIPVLVEKPLTCTLEETRQLRELALTHGVHVVAGQMRRFNREAVWLQRWIMANRDHFGDLHSFDLQSWQNILGWLGRGRAGTPWLLDGTKAGGGVVISLAVHQLDLIRFLTGCDYAQVMAMGRFDPPFVNGAESSAVVLLTMDNGAAGALHASYTTPRTPYSEAMNLFGSHGTIIQRAESIGQYHGPFRYASVANKETVNWNQMYEDFDEVPEADVSNLHENPFVNQLLHFATSLHDGTRPANHIDDNFNTMACIQGINDSLRSGRAEHVAGLPANG